MKIKFVENFVSATFGNVWFGRVVDTTEDQALKFINIGYAEKFEESEEIKEVKNVDIDDSGNKEPSSDRPKRRGRPASNLS